MSAITAINVPAQFTDLLSRIARGEEVEITENGRTVARLVPPTAKEDDDDERPWRGSFCPYPPPDPHLYDELVRQLALCDIPHEEPYINMNWHRPEVIDDE